MQEDVWTCIVGNTAVVIFSCRVRHVNCLHSSGEKKTLQGCASVGCPRVSEIGDELRAKPTFWIALKSNALERERWIFGARSLAEMLPTVLAQSCGSDSLRATSAGASWWKGLQFAKRPEDKACLCLVWLKWLLQNYICCICWGKERMVSHNSANWLLWKKFLWLSFSKSTVQLLK